MRRRLPLLVSAPLICLAFIGATLYLGRDRLSRPLFLSGGRYGNVREPVLGRVVDGTILPAANITEYLEAIFHTQPSSLPTLQCPAINAKRYNALRRKDSSDPGIKYLFALNLRQNLPLLPRLIGSVIEAITFLGPEQCALSIVEGNSPDGTADVLVALRSAIESIGATYYFKSSKIDPSKDDRVGRLAQLRNLALQPLMDAPGNFTKDSTVMFLNDVAACAEDTLELLHQRRALGADMTCAMDWTYVAQDPSFYDVWISRDINGDSFFEIPPDGSWSRAWTLFWNDEKTQNRFAQKRPFQVFACWNGAAAFATKPIIKDKVLFRGAHEKIGECRQGEPQLFCKDLWYKGYGKIAVIPSVNLEYSIGNGLRIKVEKGYTSDTVSKQDAAGDRIKWQLEPPEKVKCMPTWQNQHWQMWNFTLKG